MKHRNIPPLSLNEAARLLAVSPRTVSRFIDRGDINAIRIGSTLAIPFDGMPTALRRCFDADPPLALLTLHDVAARLRCSPDDVRSRTASGELKSVKIGRSDRWAPSEIRPGADDEDRP
jgi:excisionase family DNA binding protein